jgi:hypothetical protein
MISHVTQSVSAGLFVSRIVTIVGLPPKDPNDDDDENEEDEDEDEDEQEDEPEPAVIREPDESKRAATVCRAFDCRAYVRAGLHLRDPLGDEAVTA